MINDFKIKKRGAIFLIKRKRGVALMLVLLALVIMSVIVVDFQSKSALFQRSSAGRINIQKCRYGAESGLILAQKMITMALKNNSWVDFTDPEIEDPNNNDPNNNDPNNDDLNNDEDLGFLGNTLGINEDDPNSKHTKDPNVFDYNTEFIDSPFILAKKEITVGDVKVSFEIQDENGKFPLLWYLRSPYSASGTGSGARQLDAFIKSLNIDPEYGVLVKKLASDIVKNIPLDNMELHLKKNIVKPGRRRSRRRTRARLSYSKKQDLKAKRYENMAMFGTQFRKRIREDDEMSVLSLPINKEGLVLTDYLGIWGTFKVNLVTAPVEVLESAFGEIGLTNDMALSMVEYRSENAIESVLNFRNAPDVEQAVIKDLYKAAIYKTENFSVHIIATCGNASYKLVTNIQSYLGKLMITAIVRE